MWFYSCCSRGLKLIIIFLHLPSSVSAYKICCYIPFLWFLSLAFTFPLIRCVFLPQAIPCCFPIKSIPLHQNCLNFPSILHIFLVLTFFFLWIMYIWLHLLQNWWLLLLQYEKNVFIAQYLNKQFTSWYRKRRKSRSS